MSFVVRDSDSSPSFFSHFTFGVGLKRRRVKADIGTGTAGNGERCIWRNRKRGEEERIRNPFKKETARGGV